MQKSKEAIYESKQKNEVIFNFLSLLDQCKQILRDDRIWLRNQIKAGDQDTIEIFSSFKKPINIQKLQINLRKYLTFIKSKAKMDQLLKFKENLGIRNLSNQRTSNINYYEDIQKKREFSSNHHLIANRSTISQNFKSQNIKHNMSANSRNFARCNSPINEQKMTPALKKLINQPNPRNFPDEPDDGYYKINQNKLKYGKTTQFSNNNGQNCLLKPSNMASYFQNYKKNQQSVNGFSEYCGLDTYNNEDYDQITNQLGSRIPPSNLNKYKNKQIIKNQNNQRQIVQKIHNQRNQSKILSKQNYQKTTKIEQINNKLIFTSPQLLKQCRKFLQKNQYKDFSNAYSKESLNIYNNQQEIFSLDKYPKNRNQVATHPQQLKKYQIQNNEKGFLKEHTKQSNSNLIYGQQTNTLLKKQFQRINNKDLRRDKNTAQQVIDALEDYIKNGQVGVNEIISVIPSDLLQQFKQTFSDFNDCLQINVLGRFLNERMVESGGNTVKDLQNILDIDQKGYATSEDIENFINQLKQAGAQCYQQLEYKLTRIYEKCVSSDGRMYYWNTYLLSKSQQFLQVCQILEQFQFQIQS